MINIKQRRLRSFLKGFGGLLLFFITMFLFNDLFAYPLLAVVLLQNALMTFVSNCSASPFFFPLILVVLFITALLLITHFKRYKWLLLMIGIEIVMLVLTHFADKLLILSLYLAITRAKLFTQLSELPLLLPLIIGGLGLLLVFKKTKKATSKR